MHKMLMMMVVMVSMVYSMGYQTQKIKDLRYVGVKRYNCGKIEIKKEKYTGSVLIPTQDGYRRDTIPLWKTKIVILDRDMEYTFKYLTTGVFSYWATYTTGEWELVKANVNYTPTQPTEEYIAFDISNLQDIGVLDYKRVAHHVVRDKFYTGSCKLVEDTTVQYQEDHSIGEDVSGEDAAGMAALRAEHEDGPDTIDDQELDQ